MTNEPFSSRGTRRRGGPFRLNEPGERAHCGESRPRPILSLRERAFLPHCMRDVHRNWKYFLKLLDTRTNRAQIGREDAASGGRLPSRRRRREKSHRNGRETCALRLGARAQAQSGAQTAPALTRADGRARGRDTRETGSRRAGWPAAGTPLSAMFAAFGAAAASTPPVTRFAAFGAAAGTEWNETGWRNGMRDTDGQQRERRRGGP